MVTKFPVRIHEETELKVTEFKNTQLEMKFFANFCQKEICIECVPLLRKQIQLKNCYTLE